MEDLNDFGTGLRAHLGLEEEVLELLAQAVHEPENLLDEAVLDEEEHDEPDVEATTLETLIAFEHELLARERDLALREQKLAVRAGALLAAAQTLHDEVVGSTSTSRDELARMRQRKSGAA